MQASIKFDKYNKGKVLQVYNKPEETEEQVVKQLLETLNSLKYDKDGTAISE